MQNFTSLEFLLTVRWCTSYCGYWWKKLELPLALEVTYRWISIIQNCWEIDDVEQRWVNFKFGFIVILSNTCKQNLEFNDHCILRIQTISHFASKHCIQSVMKKSGREKKVWMIDWGRSRKTRGKGPKKLQQECTPPNPPPDLFHSNRKVTSA